MDPAAEIAGDEFPPPDATWLVKQELEPGERLVWFGRPRGGLVALRALPASLGGLLFLAFSLFFFSQAYWTMRSGPDPLFLMFSLVFFTVVTGMIASPLWAWWKSGRTWYALTDRRALVGEPRWGSAAYVQSYYPASLGRMGRWERGDGSGDLVFNELLTIGSRDATRTIRRGFLAIDRVREVESLVRRTLLSPPSS